MPPTILPDTSINPVESRSTPQAITTSPNPTIISFTAWAVAGFATVFSMKKGQLQFDGITLSFCSEDQALSFSLTRDQITKLKFSTFLLGYVYPSTADIKYSVALSNPKKLAIFGMISSLFGGSGVKQAVELKAACKAAGWI